VEKMDIIDLNKSVYQLTEEYPRLIDIMILVGFKDIGNPVVRKTAGRAMTIPKGCKMRGIDIDLVITKLEKGNFQVINI